MGALDIENVVKEFSTGDILAVEDLNLKIKDGEFLVVVGPSGCGKSTTLNMIAGLEKPTSGSIRLEGADITNLPPQERDSAMVFQNYALYPHMNVEKNIGFGLRMSTDVSGEELDRRVREAAELLQIEDLLDQRPAELSGGQQQRVALGRAIVRKPEVFLMDEPLSNLDAKLRSDMRTEIQRLQNSLGITTVYVTHDQTEAMTMGDRIAIMNDGRLQQVATPEEVYHKPTNRFVAGFIGEPSMNFFDVTISEGNSLQFEGTDVSYDLSVVPEDVRDHSDDLVLGIRPNQLELDTGENPDFEAEVQVVEPMGEYNLLHGTFGGESYTVKVAGDRRPAEMSVTGFSIPQDQIYLFDRASGAAIHHPSVREVPA
ncbi:ABC transporter ATP-binding protein [Halococcus agarilyticus]|uniref:ABC transporter ATP-binding protein n=1 Tax=Halococcus agarilyticus TaxID=1232219 RepID=UPI0006779E43|nr:ABC transporter ATP-binding protein [Halococcus agarilyticus]